jgi:hypothetical protein
VEDAKTLKRQADKALAAQKSAQSSTVMGKPASQASGKKSSFSKSNQSRKKKCSTNKRKNATKAVVNAKKITADAVKRAVGKNAKTIKTVVIGKSVKIIAPKSFAKAIRVTTLEVTSKKLTKKSVKRSLEQSKVKNVRVKVGSTYQNKKYLKTYKKYFATSNSGKTVTMKIG